MTKRRQPKTGPETDEVLAVTEEPGRPHQASLRMDGWENLFHWLNWRIDVTKVRVAGYKAAKKQYKTETFDGQIKYWEHQISCYTDIRENLVKANG